MHTFGAAAHRCCASLLRENLVAERIAIDSSREFINYLRDQDPTTRRLLESILAMEEEHAYDLADLLQQMPESKKSDKKSSH